MYNDLLVLGLIRMNGVLNLGCSAWCIIQPVGRFLHASTNAWGISHVRRDVANDVTILIICFSLEKCCRSSLCLRPLGSQGGNHSSSVTHQHQDLEGNAGAAGSVTNLAQVYPYQFCQDLARIILRHLKVKPLVTTKCTFSEQQSLGQQSARVEMPSKEAHVKTSRRRKPSKRKPFRPKEERKECGRRHGGGSGLCRRPRQTKRCAQKVHNQVPRGSARAAGWFGAALR